MQMLRHMSRRRFLESSAVASVAALGLPQLAAAAVEGKQPKLRLAVKYGMIRVPDATPQAKLELVKKIGFEGVEIQAPGEVDLEAIVAASQSTGIKIHGVIDSVHWKERLSDPSEEVRRKAVGALQEAIRAAQKVGADTCLLVPGKVSDPKVENFEQCWERSQAGVRECLKLAEECKVVIAIETVWNDFITKPEHMIRYVDEINSPWCGAYFDCSNMLKYGVSSADWIRQLGKRLVKFDFKGYSHATGFKTPIGEGDENWPEVLKALGEIGYDGWATSEVSGGGEKELTDIYGRMAKALGKA
ncbi:MAG: sugar phosphate isomerase/epimerase family protein [Pirellulales bacterium]